MNVGGGDASTPLTRPPTSPAPNFSDDFDSLDSLANYTIWNQSTNTNMARLGDVSFTTNTLTANQYNASVYGGVFYLQLPAIVQSVYLYRAVTAGDHMYTGHIAPQIAGAQPAGANGVASYFFVAANSAGRPDLANHTALGNVNGDANWHSITRIGAVNVNDSTRAYDIPSAVGTADQFVGTVRTSWVYNLEDGRAMRFLTGTAFTPTRAWFGYAFGTATRTDDCIFGLYFLRELPAPTSWWVSTAPSSGGGGGGGGGGGDIVEIVAGTGIAVTNGTGPVVTVAATGGGGTLAGDANGPAGTNTVNAIHETSGPTQLTFGNINDFQLLQRVGATVVGTAYPPTTLVGDVNGPLISNQVNAIHETSGPTQLTLGAIADGQVLTRVGATVVGSVLAPPTTADITSRITPLHWWRADNTVQSGGLVDTIVDNGSSAKNFTQTGTARCPTAVDGDGDTYLAFDGANDYYTAGVTSDWTFTTNGSPWTMAVVTSRAAPAGANEDIVGSGGTNPANIGAAFTWVVTSATAQGPFWAVGNASGSTYTLFIENRLIGSGKELFIFRVFGDVTFASVGGVSSGTITVQLRRTGFLAATSYRNTGQGFSASTPSQPWTLGRRAGAATDYTNARIYEVITDNKCWTDEQVAIYESYVGSNYAIPALVSPGIVGLGGNFVDAVITDYSAKPTPVAADQIYIADSAASNAIKRATAREVAVAGGGMYEAYPGTTDSWSDEFDGGSSDPTARGWSVVQIYPSVAAMTRLGDVDYTIVPPTDMSPGQYRSTVRNGKLYIQVGGNSTNIMYIYKAITTAAFSYIVSGISSNFASAVHRISMMMCDTVAFPFVSPSAKSVTVAQEGNDLLSFKFTGSTQSLYGTGTAADIYSAKSFVLDYKSGAQITCSAVRTLDDATLHNTINQVPPTSWTPAFAGVMVENSNVGALNWTAIDYIRRGPSGVWFPV